MAENSSVRATGTLAERLATVGDLCNCTAARTASRYLSAAYDKALAPTGLRATQLVILTSLALDSDGMTISGLAELIAMDRTTLATNLKPLERDGLLTVRTSDTDRRARTVAITDAGVARLEEGVVLWEAMQRRFEDAFGSARAAGMRTDLRAVLATGFDPWAE
jgi:DNA-binding MarR family transcriptional regulator